MHIVVDEISVGPDHHGVKPDALSHDGYFDIFPVHRIHLGLAPLVQPLGDLVGVVVDRFLLGNPVHR